MTTVVINKPGADTTVSYDIASGDKIVFKTPLKNFKMNLVGSDVVLYWPDGGKVVLVGAGLSMFNAEDTTLFETVDGKIMTGNELLAQMGKLETVLASEIDKISAVFEKKDQDTTADSKEIQQLKSLLKEKSATPSFKAIDEVLSPTDALNPEVNQSKLQEVMRKADESFRRVQDEDGFHGRYNMISAPPITPVDPGLPPPEPAKPEYFSLSVRHSLSTSGNNGGSGGLGSQADTRFAAENLTATEAGVIYGDDPSKFDWRKMEQVLNFTVNDLTDFEAGLKQSGLLKGSLDTYKFTIEVPGGLPDGVLLSYQGSPLNFELVGGNPVYTVLMGGGSNININIQYSPLGVNANNTFTAVMKAYFYDSGVPAPEEGEPEYAFIYNDVGDKSRFTFVDPTAFDANKSIFNNSLALSLSPVGTNITGSSGNDTIVPGIGRSGAAANTIDGGAGTDIMDYPSMFEQAGLPDDTQVIVNNSGKVVTYKDTNNKDTTIAPGGTVFIDSKNASFSGRRDILKNIELVKGGAGNDIFYGNAVLSTNKNFSGFDGGAGTDTLDFSGANIGNYGGWAGVDAYWGKTGNIYQYASSNWLGAVSDVEKFVGSPFADRLFLYPDAPKDTTTTSFPYDGGGGNDLVSFRNVPAGTTASNVLYFDADSTSDADGYRTAWIGDGTSGNGTEYKIKNFENIEGTVNNDVVDLRGSSFTRYATGGGMDKAVGTNYSELAFNNQLTNVSSFSNPTTFTFNGTTTTATVNLGSLGTVTEDRVYTVAGGLADSGVQYAGFNRIFGFGTGIFKFEGNNPTGGFAPETTANPWFLYDGNNTVDLSKVEIGEGVVFLAGGNFWENNNSSLNFSRLGGTSIDISMEGRTTGSNNFKFRISGVTEVVGTQYDDILASSARGQVSIDAGKGNDSLYSVDTYRIPNSKTIITDNVGDTLNGGDDNDVFYRIVDGKSGGVADARDTLIGGAGIDTLVLPAVTVPVGADPFNQAVVIGGPSPVRAFYNAGQPTPGEFGSNYSAYLDKGRTRGALLQTIENVVLGGAGFVADSGDGNDGTSAVGNQYWFTADGETATKNTPAAMLFNGSSTDRPDTVTTYTGNVLVYFDGLGTANINQPGGTYSIGSAINNQSINMNPSTGVLEETLGSGQVSLFALGNVGNASGQSVTINLTNSTSSAGGTLQYFDANNTAPVGGVNKIWRPSLSQDGADDDIYAIYTTAKGDTITGDAFGNIVFTGGGKDTVSVGAGKDTVYAAGGEATSLNLGNDNDVLEAAFYKTSVMANTSTVDGGSGTDELRFGLKSTDWTQPKVKGIPGRQILGVEWHTDGVNLTLSSASAGSVSGTATGNLLGSGNTINFSGFENFHLTNGADTVTVNDTAMSALTGSNLIDASPLRLDGIYRMATTRTRYSPAGYNSANDGERFRTDENTPEFNTTDYAASTGVDTIKYSGSVGVDASDFVTKGFKSFEKIDLTGLSLSSGNTSFDVKVSDILALSESRTLIIERNNSLSITVANDVGGWSGTTTTTTTSGSQVYTFTKSGEQNVVLAITG
ncbi:MAG: hypothetical protein ACK5O9_03260 [Holosporales bacterium]